MLQTTSNIKNLWKRISIVNKSFYISYPSINSLIISNMFDGKNSAEDTFRSGVSVYLAGWIKEKKYLTLTWEGRDVWEIVLKTITLWKYGLKLRRNGYVKKQTHLKPFFILLFVCIKHDQFGSYLQYLTTNMTPEQTRTLLASKQPVHTGWGEGAKRSEQKKKAF